MKFLILTGYLIGYLVANAIITLIWNAIMPDLFGFKQIGYFQMLGLACICSYLFKSHKYKTNKE